jgi:tRNA threonylcarbamoyladenosine biosynthesis protein TsaB
VEVVGLGVPTLDALAVQGAADLGLDPDDEVLVATDARRKEVYWARYRVVAHEGPHGVPVVERLRGPEVGRAADVAATQLDPPSAPDARLVVVGEGAELYAEHLPAADDAPTQPDTVVLARLALARRAAGEDLPTDPLYLRRPDVQEPAGAKRATGVAP